MKKSTRQKLEWFITKFKPFAWFCAGGLFGIFITYFGL